MRSNQVRSNHTIAIITDRNRVVRVHVSIIRHTFTTKHIPPSYSASSQQSSHLRQKIVQGMISFESWFQTTGHFTGFTFIQPLTVGFFLLHNRAGKTVIFVCPGDFKTGHGSDTANRIYENFTQAVNVDSLSDLGLFNLPRVAGWWLMSMAVHILMLSSYETHHVCASY